MCSTVSPSFCDEGDDGRNRDPEPAQAGNAPHLPCIRCDALEAGKRLLRRVRMCANKVVAGVRTSSLLIRIRQ
jgi:hypothetical protein